MLPIPGGELVPEAVQALPHGLKVPLGSTFAASFALMHSIYIRVSRMSRASRSDTGTTCTPLPREKET